MPILDNVKYKFSLDDKRILSGLSGNWKAWGWIGCEGNKKLEFVKRVFWSKNIGIKRFGIRLIIECRDVSFIESKKFLKK